MCGLGRGVMASNRESTVGIPDSQDLIRAVAGHNATCAANVASTPSSHPGTRTPATEAPLVHPGTPQPTRRLVRGLRGPRLEVCSPPRSAAPRNWLCWGPHPARGSTWVVPCTCAPHCTLRPAPRAARQPSAKIGRQGPRRTGCPVPDPPAPRSSPASFICRGRGVSATQAQPGAQTGPLGPVARARGGLESGLEIPTLKAPEAALPAPPAQRRSPVPFTRVGREVAVAHLLPAAQTGQIGERSCSRAVAGITGRTREGGRRASQAGTAGRERGELYLSTLRKLLRPPRCHAARLPPVRPRRKYSGGNSFRIGSSHTL